MDVKIESHNQQKDKLPTFKELTYDFADNTTLHGLPRSFKTSVHLFRRLVWLGIFFGCSGYFTFQVIELINDYSTWPILIKSEMKLQTFMKFPAVTICNMNMLRKSKIKGTAFQGLIDLDEVTVPNLAQTVSPDQTITENKPTATDQTMAMHATTNPSNNTKSADGTITTSDLATKATTTAYVAITTTDHVTIQDEMTASAYQTTITDEATTTTDINWVTDTTTTTADKNTSIDVTTGTTVENRNPETTSAIVTPTLDNSSCTCATCQDPCQYNTIFDSTLAPTATNADPVDETYLSEVQNYGYSPSSDTGYYEPFTFKESPFTNIKDPNNFAEILKSSAADDLSDIIGLATPTMTQLDEYAHNVSDLVALCTFDGENCNMSSDHWLETYNKYYGKCYTWNSAINKPNGERPLVTTNFGSRYGLRLTLNVERDEYTGLFSQTYGVRVSVHENAVVSYPESEGLTVSVGSEMLIRTRQKKYERQRYPYPSKCVDGYKSATKINRGDYTVLGCMLECLEVRLFERCKCFDRIVDSNKHRCSFFNRTEELCRQKVYYAYNAGKLGCICPAKCREAKYHTSTSISAWPNHHHDYYLLERLKHRDDITLENIKDNILRVHIYFEDFNEETVKEIPVYTISGLLSNIGGTMGLFIGLSLCTVGEFLELVLEIIILLCRKLSSRIKKNKINITM